MIWHYAVWKASHPYMWPACMPVGAMVLKGTPITQHGLNTYRGCVNCEDCLRMMGPT